MSTISASYHKLAHGRNSGSIIPVALLIVTAVVLIVAAIMTTLSETSPQINEADLLPLLREPVVPVPMAPARALQPSLTATPAPPVKEWASPVIPSPVPVPTPSDGKDNVWVSHTLI